MVDTPDDSQLHRSFCRLCGKSGLITFANMGATPLADKFISVDEIKDEKSFPLMAVVCPICKLVQLNCDVNDDLLFGSDYAFFTSGSPSSIKYFEDYAKDLLDKYPKQSKGFVVEIASNDGTLLKHFQSWGAKVLGIDPALPAAKMAEDSGIPTITRFFNGELASEGLIVDADLIMANNVIAHVSDLNDVIAGVKNVLAKDGIFAFEVQYFANLLFNNEFDHIYHEHRSFFSFFAVKAMLANHGLKVVDVMRTDGQGGSLRVFATHTGSRNRVSDRVAELNSLEESCGIENQVTYMDYQKHIDFVKIELLRLLNELKAVGKTVYGYGASAKSCTLLNYCDIGPELLPVIVDKTPYKIGKLSPGKHIPIVDKIEKDPDYYLLLVWNYLPGILKRESSFVNNGGRFIIPIPVPKII